MLSRAPRVSVVFYRPSGSDRHLLFPTTQAAEPGEGREQWGGRRERWFCRDDAAWPDAVERAFQTGLGEQRRAAGPGHDTPTLS